MSMIKRYLEDRDEAMLAYPDTSKLEELYNKWPGLFPPDFKRLFKNSSPEFKILVLEKMILQWAEAPEELIIKVKQRRGLLDEKEDSGLLEEE